MSLLRITQQRTNILDRFFEGRTPAFLDRTSIGLLCLILGPFLIPFLLLSHLYKILEDEYRRLKEALRKPKKKKISDWDGNNE